MKRQVLGFSFKTLTLWIVLNQYFDRVSILISINLESSLLRLRKSYAIAFFVCLPFTPSLQDELARGSCV